MSVYQELTDFGFYNYTVLPGIKRISFHGKCITA